METFTPASPEDLPPLGELITDDPFWSYPAGVARMGIAHLGGLTGRFGPSLVLLEHYPAPEIGEGIETFDLVRIGPDGSPHWTRVWPTPEDNPRYAGLELWMANYGHQIISRPASWFDRCEDEGSSGAGTAARPLKDL